MEYVQMNGREREMAVYTVDDREELLADTFIIELSQFLSEDLDDLVERRLPHELLHRLLMRQRQV